MMPLCLLLSCLLLLKLLEEAMGKTLLVQLRVLSLRYTTLILNMNLRLLHGHLLQALTGRHAIQLLVLQLLQSYLLHPLLVLLRL